MKSNAVFQAAFHVSEKEYLPVFHSTGRQASTWPSSEVLLTLYKLRISFTPLAIETQVIQVSFQHSLDNELKVIYLEVLPLSEAVQLTFVRLSS